MPLGRGAQIPTLKEQDTRLPRRWARRAARAAPRPVLWMLQSEERVCVAKSREPRAWGSVKAAVRASAPG